MFWPKPEKYSHGPLLAALLALWPLHLATAAVQDPESKLPVDTLPATWNWLEPPLGIAKIPDAPPAAGTEAKIQLGRRCFSTDLSDGSMSGAMSSP
jgi:hypothetical protein